MNASVLNSYKKREVRVFISSTFRDMMGEREILVKKVFPNLRYMFKDRGIMITEVDLRWGVLEEEAQNGKVIEICLSEIDKSRPYFIGILGERYGWVPEISEYQKHKKIIEDFPWVEEDIQNGLSITEMEVQYGVLRNPGMIARSAFFIRETDSAIVNQIEQSEKQNRLKETIKTTEGLQHTTYKRIDELAELISQHLIKIIVKDYPEEDVDLNIQQQLNFINSRKLAYVKNEDYYFVIDKHFENSNTPLVITGDRGIGKSSLLANYLTDYAAKNPEGIYLFNFSDASVDSSDYIKVLKRFNEELAEQGGNLGSGTELESFNDILSHFVKLLKETYPNPVIIVIDGIDEFIDDEHSRLIHWLPDSFPENVKVILSCGESAQLDRVKEKHYRVYDLSKFTTKFKTDFINSYFNYFSKKLPQEIIDEIIADEISDLPLTLQSMADELRQYGLHEGLKERVQYYLKADGPVDYYNRVLIRLEEDFNSEEDELVKNILSVMALFSTGMKEQEIQQILNITPLAFSSVFNSIENNLLNKDGYYTFGNQYFRKAVELRYLHDRNVINQIRENIISYLITVVWTQREIMEAAHQVTELKDYDRLYELLSSVRHLLYLHQTDRFLLIKYWTLIKDEHKITDAYNEENINAYVAEMEGDNELLITLYNIVAALLYDMGMYEESEPYFKNIYELSLKHLGEAAEYTYSNLKRLINIELKLNKNDEALLYAAKLLGIGEDYYEETDQMYIQSLYQLGRVYLARKEYDKAINAFHFVVQGLNKYYDEKSNDDDRLKLYHLDVLEDMIKCYLHMDMAEKAIEEAKGLIGLKIEMYGEVSPETADAYQSMGTLNMEAGSYETAAEYYKNSYEIRSKLFGKYHPITNEVLDDLKKLHELKKKNL